MSRKLNLNFLLLIFVLFVNVPSAYLLLNKNFSFIIETLQILTFIVTFLIFIVYSKKKNLSKIIVFITLFWAVYIVSTYLHNGNVNASVKPLLNTFTLCAIFIIYKENLNLLIKTFLLYFELLITINLITILIYPNGLYMISGNVNPHYFLGHRNNSIEYILPLICFSNISDYINDKKNSVNNVYVIVLSFLTVLLTWSANAMVVVGYLIVSLYLPTKKFIHKKINCVKFFIGYLIAFVSIIIYRLQYYFSWLIVDILHRSLDFTYRTYIWDRSLYWIKKSLFIGYGYENEILKTSKITHPNSCHNYLLDFMYMGGFLMILLLVIILFSTFYKINNSKGYSKYIITSIICGYFILWFATPIHKDVLGIMFLIFTIGYNIEYIERCIK